MNLPGVPAAGALLLVEDALEKLDASFTVWPARADWGPRRAQHNTFLVWGREAVPNDRGMVKLFPTNPFGSSPQPSSWELIVAGDAASSTVSSECWTQECPPEVSEFWALLESALVKVGIWRPRRGRRRVFADPIRDLIAEALSDREEKASNAACAGPRPAAKTPQISDHIRARAKLIHEMKSQDSTLSHQAVATRINLRVEKDEGLRVSLGLRAGDELTGDDVRYAYRAMARIEGRAKWRWKKGGRSY